MLAPDEDGDEAVDEAHVGGEPPLPEDGDGEGDREDGAGAQEVHHAEGGDQLVTDQSGLGVAAPDGGDDEQVGQHCHHHYHGNEEDLCQPRHDVDI